MAEIINTKLKSPATMIIFGNSNCGKTELFISMLQNQEATWGRTFDNIYILFTSFQKRYDDLKASVKGVHLISSFDEIPVNMRDCIVVFDDKFLDFQSNKGDKNLIQDIFFRLSHHRQMFIIVIMQSLHNHG